MKRKNLAKAVRQFILLTLFCGVVAVTAFAADIQTENSLAGKKISILGDSISTYAGVSNKASVNPTLKSSRIYYKKGYLGIYRRDTWWQQAIDETGMELLVNNSWSGSCILKRKAGASAAYKDRCVQLHDVSGAEPDIIAIHMGTNDLSGSLKKIGTAGAIQYEKLIREENGSYIYATPKTVCEAYAIMLHKISQRYLNAEIYCFTVFPKDNLTPARLRKAESFSRSIAKIADTFGAHTVDLYNDSGIKLDTNYYSYISKKKKHPVAAGMDAMTGCFTSALLKNSRYVSGKVYDVSYDLSNVIVDQGTAYAALASSSFSCGFTVPENHKLKVTVKMGGKDITDRCYQDGKLTIDKVVGDVQIRAKSVGHKYTLTVTTKPTCGARGYTTHTCDCGASYRDSYVKATGKHTYKKGTCTVCGKTTTPPVITRQPEDDTAELGARYAVKVKAKGKSLEYQWYYRNAGGKTWNKSSCKSSTYKGMMNRDRAGREVYCVITDAYGNRVKTEVAKLLLKSK